MAAFDTFIENMNIETAQAMKNLTILIKIKYTKGISINYAYIISKLILIII